MESKILVLLSVACRCKGRQLKPLSKYNAVDKLVYREPNLDGGEYDREDSKMFSIRSADIDLPAPPKNSSEAAKADLLAVKRETDKGNFENYAKYDAQFTDKFYTLVQTLGSDITLDEIKSVSREVRGYVHYFKYKFNRPRPFQLGPAIGIELITQGTSSGDTPAYPSGHTTQSRVLAHWLSDKMPEHRRKFMALAEEIGLSRIEGGVHYPTDHEAGKQLADTLWQNQSITEEVLLEGKVEAIINKIKNMPKVKELVNKHYTDVTSLAIALLSLPLISKLVFGMTGDKLNQARMIAQGLTRVVIGEETINEDECQKYTPKQIADLEKFADRLLNKFGIDIEFTRHFADRMNDARNRPCIKISELQQLFKKMHKAGGKRIKGHGEGQAVVLDLQRDLNLPVVIDLLPDRTFEVRTKTIMRKKNFKTPNKRIMY